MRPSLPLLAALVLAAPGVLAQGTGPTPGGAQLRSRAIANAVTPPSTGNATCDDAVAAWRACIAASPKAPADRAQANTEVDKFVRDVFDARGSARDDLVRACGPTASGYRQMVENGTCGANITGARDDQATRVGAPAAAVAAQRRAQR
ncbi:hypothetical protein EAH89_23340 [Roseomonas nepalensis]|uniref:UrcA family protein n=1 Tax=Muricoccus nepalensis TaxID=1854500 RepID=A0A502FFH0_9PROT|nr:hypothetical protein [Roseomonas nepalensis]TPG48131.1 hypothetical protein EAH89_23340 [Roseomonas nepalensis]